MKDDKDEIIEVFSGTLWESEMVTSLLKDSEIQSFLKNSILDSYAYNPVYSNEAKVMIFASDIEKAKKIVDGYCRNSKHQ
jgi:hypothetical protein